MRLRFSLALAAIAAPLTAQAPYRYLVVAEAPTPAGPVGPALAYVEPATGVVTPLRQARLRPLLRAAHTVALDPGNPPAIYMAGGLGSLFGPPVRVLTMQGSLVKQSAPVRITGPRGMVARLHVSGPSLLFTMGASFGASGAGLWRVPRTGGRAAQLLKAAGAFDVTTIGAKAYVVTSRGTSASTLFEYDLTAGRVRTLGSAYPPLRAIAPFGKGLVAGGRGGVLYTIDVATGKATVLARPGKGAIEAIATDPVSKVFYFATSSSVWSFANLSRPVHTTRRRIRDLDVSPFDVASLLLFGQGCKGSNASTPAHAYTIPPALGTPGFSMRVVGARPSAPAFLVLGASRTVFGSQKLPMSLDGLGMTGCRLYTDHLMAIGLATDRAGQGSVPLPIPNLGYKGAHFMGQFFVVDSGANALGLVASDGAEAIVR